MPSIRAGSRFVAPRRHPSRAAGRRRRSSL